jgi:hypothetical protein
MAFAFTGSSGRMALAMTSPMGGMFTTAMRTRPTIHPTTWSSCTDQSTSRTTRRATAGRSQASLTKRLRHGMDRLWGMTGMSSIMRSLATFFTRRRSLSVINAAHRLSVWTTAATAFVRTTANRRGVALLGSTMSRGSVSCAAGSSPSTSTWVPNVAAENVGRNLPIRCVRIDDVSERADVYCLRVPATRAFAVNSGIIVSNCMDACRYLVMSGLDIATPRPQTQWNRKRTQHLIEYDPTLELWKRTRG